MKRVSIVVPIYNEMSLLNELMTRLQFIMNANQQYQWELIYVNDGSSDGTGEKLTHFVKSNSNLHILHLSRNFGHQIAITAGMDYATGDAVIVMDGDLQDPPELLPSFLVEWEAGHDIVFAVRSRRKAESIFKKLACFVHYRILEKMADTRIPLDSGDFRLMSRPVVETLKRMPEHNRYIRGMVSWVGFSQTSITYERDPRFSGPPKYTLIKLIRLAMDGMFSFSKVPLRTITVLGYMLSVCSFLGLVFVVFSRFFNHSIPGWSSLMACQLFMGGVQLCGLGIIGEYIGRIFDEVRQRPLYVVQRIDIQSPPVTTDLSLSVQ